MTQARQLSAIGRLHAVFEDLGIPYWLFGGWAVDFHAGRVTREHADIDMAVWLSDLDRTNDVLAHEGWEVTVDSVDHGYLELQNGSLHLDLTFLARDESTGEVYTPLPEGRGTWAAGAFGGHIAELGGVRAQVVGLDSLMADKSEDHSDPVSAMKDAADLDVLKSLGGSR